MRPFVQEKEEEECQSRSQDFPTLAAEGCKKQVEKDRRGLLRSQGQKQLRTYPGSRKARLSGTAWVTVGSLGASKATGPSLARGSLYQRKQGVSERPLDQGCRKGLQPLFPTSPWDLPDHLDLGNHGCQEHPKKWRGEAMS